LSVSRRLQISDRQDAFGIGTGPYLTNTKLDEKDLLVLGPIDGPAMSATLRLRLRAPSEPPQAADATSMKMRAPSKCANRVALVLVKREPAGTSKTPPSLRTS
jgi:hypothetical protein